MYRMGLFVLSFDRLRTNGLLLAVSYYHIVYQARLADADG